MKRNGMCYNRRNSMNSGKLMKYMVLNRGMRTWMQPKVYWRNESGKG